MGGDEGSGLDSSYKDRRQHRRVLAAIPAWVATDGARVHVQTSDISFGGVQLAARAGDLVLEVGAKVTMALDVESRDEPLTLEGTVAWQRFDAVGIKFEEVAADDEKLIQRIVNSALGLAVEDEMFREEEATVDLGRDALPPTANIKPIREDD